jgi:1-deoxy-D-xylulose-5-phosphate synthase
MIGDGSMTAGMIYEALNELGDLKLPVVIILNDNEMSIAKPIGAISNYLSQIFTSNFYQRLKKNISLTMKEDSGVKYVAKKLDESLRLLTPGIWFEEMGFEYIGPIDGHNLKTLIDTFSKAKNLNKPVIVHVQTLKGKGYEIAEGHHESWHGVGPFDIKSGKVLKKSSRQSATSIFSNALLNLASKNKKIVGFTAAMPSGTGMDALIERYPDRFFDVAIAEQHAVTSAAAMAKEGFVPFVAIYSTFLQRGFDQIIHDVAIMSLPVVFAIDRAGIVGEDGDTHHGVFDISYLRMIPNLIIFAPSDEETLKDGIEFASKSKAPIAFRYPRGEFLLNDFSKREKFSLGVSEILKETNSNILFIGYGNGVGQAVLVAKGLDFEVSIIDLRFIKPLDEKTLRRFLNHKKWFVFSQSAKIGGVGSALLEFLSKEKVLDITLTTFEFEDDFIEHGNTSLIEKSLELDIDSMIKKIQISYKGK